MTALPIRDSRIRAFIQFAAAIFYLFIARFLARHAAMGLTSDAWRPLVEQSILVFLLLLGYSGMGFSLNGQIQPIGAQGLPARSGFVGEGGIGLAFGWGLAVLGTAAMALLGGITVRFIAVPDAGLTASLAPWGWLLADGAYFLLLTLGEEIAFRGYGFQRLVRAVGPTLAAFGYSLLAAFLVLLLLPGAGGTGAFVAFLFNLLLTLAYLRSRALWLSWGLNFAWKASRALLFGLAVSGNTAHSPLVEGDPMGAFWLTGGGFGLDGSWFTFLVLLAALPVLYRLTRELDFRYNAPDLTPGGIPVDIDAAARAQHEAAMAHAEPAAPALIQIAPLASLQAPSAPTTSPSPEGNPNNSPVS
jgi:uncharacterized protein